MIYSYQYIITCSTSYITRKGKTHGRWSYCRVSIPPPNPDGQDNKDDSIRNLLLSLNRCKFVGITKITKRDCFLDLRATKYQRIERKTVSEKVQYSNIFYSFVSPLMCTPSHRERDQCNWLRSNLRRNGLCMGMTFELSLSIKKIVNNYKKEI